MSEKVKKEISNVRIKYFIIFTVLIWILIGFLLPSFFQEPEQKQLLAGKHSFIHSEQLQSNGKLYFYERHAEKKKKKGNFSGRNSNKRFSSARDHK